MVKMIEVRRHLQALATSASPNVYYQKAPEDAVFPYAVLDIPNSTDDGTLERLICDVDGWGAYEDTSALENMMDAIDKAFHRTKVTIENDGQQLVIMIYRENRLTFDETERRIHRRRYVYQVRTYIQ
jgi:hypothetical protein